MTISAARLGIDADLRPRLEAAGWIGAGGVVPAAAALLEQLGRGPEPEAARERLARLLETAPEVAEAALADRSTGSDLVRLVGASRALTDWVGRHPDWFLERDGRLASGAGEPGPRMAALRHTVQRRLLAIALADLAGTAPMPAAGRQLAELADYAAAEGLAIAADLAEAAMPGGHPVPFAVIAMGKWGGLELNYSSDIDLLFVYDVPEGIEAAAAGRWAARVAQGFMVAVGANTAEGTAFRVDADLRPEGKDGPLARSLAGYRAYYQRWADTWEFQALIKARPAAGDPELGDRFLQLARGFVYPEELDVEAIREVRLGKAKMEEHAERTGLAATEIKRGAGGIRDVEFAIQLLQLVHGRLDPDLRSPTTLAILATLGEHGYVRPDDAEELSAAYLWLRDVEHRLQLYDLRQTHDLPEDPAVRERIAKALDYRDDPAATALERFEADLIRHRATVRAIHERVFYRPLLEAFAGSKTIGLGRSEAQRQMAALGFVDAEGAERALKDLTAGLSRRSRLMGQLLPVMMEWLSESPDPDLGLAQLRLLVTSLPDNATLVGAMRDSPVAAERLCRLLGTSRLLGRLLDRIPDVLPALGHDEALATVPSRAELTDEAVRRVHARSGHEARLGSIRRFTQRRLLHGAARHLLDFADAEQVGRELSDVADATVAASLWTAEQQVGTRPDFASLPDVPFTVIAMGKWGGGELQFSSDLDALLVFDQPPGIDDHLCASFATRVAEELTRTVGGVTPEGIAFPLDLDLRPEGKRGPLARSFSGYAQYYQRWADTWEFQALIKARPVAGDPALGQRFLDLVRPYVYPAGVDEARLRDVRTMKARIERDRLPAGEDATFHLKLGKGGMVDVEFLTQLLQLQHGGRVSALQVTGTMAALHALRQAELLSEPDATALLDAYRFTARVRNHLFLQVGRPRDSLPSDFDEVSQLGRSLGYTAHPGAALREDYRRHARRARRVVERYFYRAR